MRLRTAAGWRKSICAACPSPAVPHAAANACLPRRLFVAGVETVMLRLRGLRSAAKLFQPLPEREDGVIRRTRRWRQSQSKALGVARSLQAKASASDEVSASIAAASGELSERTLYSDAERHKTKCASSRSRSSSAAERVEETPSGFDCKLRAQGFCKSQARDFAKP